MKHIIPIDSYTRKFKKLREFYYTYSIKLNPKNSYELLINKVESKLIDNQSNYTFTIKIPESIELINKGLKNNIEEEIDLIDINIFFDRIFIINLPQHKKRRKVTERRLKEQNITNYEFIEGVDGKELEDGEISRYELGCLLSHKKVVNKSKQQKYKKILVFEDDIVFHREFKKLVSILLGQESDIWYLGCSQVPNTIDTIEIVDDHIYSSNRCNGTYAFGYREEVFEDILSFRENKPIDVQLQSLQEGRSKVVYPNAVISDVSESYIRGGRDMQRYSELVCWKLEDYLFDIV